MSKIATHPSNRHHCYNLDDLKSLVMQQGYTVSEESWENEERAVAYSVERDRVSHCCVITLYKQTDTLEVITR